jgi:hypothetical protein
MRKPCGSFTLPAAQLPTALTQLSLVWPDGFILDEGLEQLSQLSSLVNLEHLALSKLQGTFGVPGGLQGSHLPSL